MHSLWKFFLDFNFVSDSKRDEDNASTLNAPFHYTLKLLRTSAIIIRIVSVFLGERYFFLI